MLANPEEMVRTGSAGGKSFRAYPLPKHLTEPFTWIAHVCQLPLETARKYPSGGSQFPRSFSPQQTSLDEFKKQECIFPADKIKSGGVVRPMSEAFFITFSCADPDIRVAAKFKRNAKRNALRIFWFKSIFVIFQ